MPSYLESRNRPGWNPNTMPSTAKPSYTWESTLIRKGSELTKSGDVDNPLNRVPFALGIWEAFDPAIQADGDLGVQQT